jgi:hypothetical protein
MGPVTSERDGEADGVLQLFEDALLKLRGDGGVDDLHLVAGAEQRRGHRENTQRRRRFLAGKRRKKEDDFLRLHS